MRILFLTSSLEIGGAERQLVACANGLRAKGHDVAVASFYPGGPLESNLVGVELIQINKAGILDSVHFVSRFVKICRNYAPDVVYSFLGTPNILAAATKPLLRSPSLIWSIRASNMDLAQYGFKSKLAHWLEMRLAFAADKIIANSNAGKEFAVSQGMSPNSIQVIPNGIDTDRFRPHSTIREKQRAAWSIKSNELLIGIAGRLDPMKDHATFLKAAKNVSDKFNTARFVCIGDGVLKDSLQRLAVDLGLGEKIIWAGEQSDMVSAYNAMDICCLSSAFGEGFPNVVGEAMSCNVPCVVTDVGDSALIVGDTGKSCPPSRLDLFTKGLMAMIDDVNGPKATTPRERILDHYSLKNMLTLTEKALNSSSANM